MAERNKESKKEHEHSHAKQDGQAKMMEFKVLEGRLEAIGKQKEMLAHRIVEIEGTMKSVEEISKAKGDVIFHLGGEAFIPGRPAENAKIIVMIGADTAVEKTPEEAKVLLQGRKKEAEDAMRTMNEEEEILSKKLQDMLPQVQSQMMM